MVQRKQRKLKTKTTTNRGHIRLKKSGDYYWLLWFAVSPGRNYITVYSVIIQIKYFTPHNNLFIAHQIFLVHKNHRIAWVFLSLSAVYSKYWNRIRRLVLLPNIFYRPKLGTRQKPLEVFYSCNLILDFIINQWTFHLSLCNKACLERGDQRDYVISPLIFMKILFQNKPVNEICMKVFLFQTTVS